MFIIHRSSQLNSGEYLPSCEVALGKYPPLLTDA